MMSACSWAVRVCAQDMLSGKRLPEVAVLDTLHSVSTWGSQRGIQPTECPGEKEGSADVGAAGGCPLVPKVDGNKKPKRSLVFAVIHSQGRDITLPWLGNSQ